MYVNMIGNIEMTIPCLKEILCTVCGIRNPHDMSLIEKFLTNQSNKDKIKSKLDSIQNSVIDLFFEYYINQDCTSEDDKFAQAYFVLSGDDKGFKALQSILLYLFEVLTNTWQIDYKDKSLHQSCNEFARTMHESTEFCNFKNIWDGIDMHGAQITYRLFAYRLYSYCRRFFVSSIKTVIFDIALSKNIDDNKDSVELSAEDDKYLVYSMAGATINS